MPQEVELYDKFGQLATPVQDSLQAKSHNGWEETDTFLGRAGIWETAYINNFQPILFFPPPADAVVPKWPPLHPIVLGAVAGVTSG